jgi:hypothetical protein
MSDDQPSTKTETPRCVVPPPARVAGPNRDRRSRALCAVREQSAEPGVTWVSLFVTEVDIRTL